MVSLKTASSSQRRYICFRPNMKVLKFPSENNSLYLSYLFLENSLLRCRKRQACGITHKFQVLHQIYLAIICFGLRVYVCTYVRIYMYTGHTCSHHRAASRQTAALIPCIITILKDIPRVKSPKTTKLMCIIYCIGYYKNSVIIFQSTSRPTAGDYVA